MDFSIEMTELCGEKYCDRWNCSIYSLCTRDLNIAETIESGPSYVYYRLISE